MQVAVKAQDGSSFFVEIGSKTSKDLFSSISSYLQLSSTQFEEQHKLVHQGRLLNVSNPLPSTFGDGCMKFISFSSCQVVLEHVGLILLIQ
jgi:hypothetical protein